MLLCCDETHDHFAGHIVCWEHWMRYGTVNQALHIKRCLTNRWIGKTTQMPQFIIEGNASAKVVVCQPRRLAAVTVAQRVAQEQHCSVGEVSSGCGSALSSCDHFSARRICSARPVQGVEQYEIDVLHIRCAASRPAGRPGAVWSHPRCAGRGDA